MEESRAKLTDEINRRRTSLTAMQFAVRVVHPFSNCGTRRSFFSVLSKAVRLRYLRVPKRQDSFLLQRCGRGNFVYSLIDIVQGEWSVSVNEQRTFLSTSKIHDMSWQN